MMDVLAATLILGGCSFALLAAVGLWRFEDLFSRIHAATKAITLGVLLTAAGAAVRMELGADILKLGLAMMLQLVSAPVSGHMLGRAAYRAGLGKSPLAGLVLDELRGAPAAEKNVTE